MASEAGERRQDRLVSVPGFLSRGMKLPEGVLVKWDPRNFEVVVITKAGDILDDRPEKVVRSWRNPPRTMAFVARYALRKRNLHGKGVG